MEKNHSKNHSWTRLEHFFLYKRKGSILDLYRTSLTDCEGSLAGSSKLNWLPCSSPPALSAVARCHTHRSSGDSWYARLAVKRSPVCWGEEENQTRSTATEPFLHVQTASPHSTTLNSRGDQPKTPLKLELADSIPGLTGAEGRGEHPAALGRDRPPPVTGWNWWGSPLPPTPGNPSTTQPCFWPWNESSQWGPAGTP